MVPTAPDPNDTEQGTTSPELVASSMRRDPDRWDTSYRDHTATTLHRRAAAAGNGHAPPTTHLPTLET